MANTNESGIKYLSDFGASGTVVGRNSSDLLGFYGATPTTRRSATSQAAVVPEVGTSSASALVASTQSVVTANRTLINQLRADLVALGIIAGA